MGDLKARNEHQMNHHVTLKDTLWKLDFEEGTVFT